VDAAGAEALPSDSVALADSVAVDGTPDAPVGPKPECASDSDCAADARICDCSGHCVLPGLGPCEEDKNCGGGKYCDPCVKQCYEKKPLCAACRSEHLCNPLTSECIPTGSQCEVDGSRCLDFVTGGSFCGQACLSDAGCPGGYGCLDLADIGIGVKQCVPKSGSCQKVKECEKDVDCEFGNICNAQFVCVAGCQKDTECPQGKVCSGFRCTAACDPVNNPCPEGQTCDVGGHCEIPGGCVDAFDCEDPETYCQPDTHLCVPGCLSTFDCKSAGKECEGGVCVQAGCPSTDWCAFGQVCDKATAECVVPPEPFCKPGCQKDEECGPEPSKCIEIQDEEGTSKGKFCFPKCYDDPENPCPQGYQCVELTDQDGKPAGKVCARACDKPPVTFE
jgi:hypothetical protein